VCFTYFYNVLLNRSGWAKCNLHAFQTQPRWLLTYLFYRVLYLFAANRDTRIKYLQLRVSDVLVEPAGCRFTSIINSFIPSTLVENTIVGVRSKYVPGLRHYAGRKIKRTPSISQLIRRYCFQKQSFAFVTYAVYCKISHTFTIIDQFVYILSLLTIQFLIFKSCKLI